MTDLGTNTGSVDPAANAQSGPAPGDHLKPKTPHATVARRRRPVLLAFCIAWLVAVTVVALIADLLPLASYSAPDFADRQRPQLSFNEPLGTDGIGRSMLSRIVFGGRVSLAVGLGAAILGAVVGGLIGMTAGYFRGRVEALITVLIDSTLAFPPLVLLLAITSVMSQSFTTLIIGLSLISVPAFARLARASTLSLSQREFVTAARSLGAGHGRILFRELMPNVALPVVSYAFVVVATMIVAEGSLSFLGLGIPPPQPSWGGMIAAGRGELSTAPHLVFVPAIVLLLTVFSFNTVGDHARRRADRRNSSL